ncbi:tyrosine recombinase XerC [Janthinobacterium sp. HH104]|uniref:tyrosine-type recombinase/integrase n=1 Tax=Janthinobacterium sp. HH104 TaxID=1537276 RepID=UPI0008933E90|nr:tyrosine-type recombinase/integrase [Janthinobacterium sp. HH104]OEZ85316.1 tyrosine recombinase XerC [Janthinobacterium sp. HH104]
MQLFFTDSQFIWHGLPRPSVPFLCDEEMELVSAPNSYLRFIAAVNGRTRSVRTWHTYANHIYEFFSFLEANAIDWQLVTHPQVAAWRDGMIDRGCSRSTVNQRLNCVNGFYGWAVRSNLTQQTPFRTEEIRIAKNRGVLAHIDVSGHRFAANSLTMQSYRPVPQFLHLPKAISFLEAITPHGLKLMGYLALLTGMRREEIIGLNLNVLPNPCGHDPSRQMPMILQSSITPTKGMKTRTVMLPYDLAVALWNFLCSVWPKRNAEHMRRHGRESSRVFLSEYGEEFSIRYMNNAFAKVSKKIQIECHPHMLRHTYGTYELLRMAEKVGQTKALLWVRDRMGHSSITTTEIYIHAADLLQNTEVDDYQIEVLRELRNEN